MTFYVGLETPQIANWSDPTGQVPAGSVCFSQFQSDVLQVQLKVLGWFCLTLVLPLWPWIGGDFLLHRYTTEHHFFRFVTWVIGALANVSCTFEVSHFIINWIYHRRFYF